MKFFSRYDEIINSVVWIVTETYDNGELVMTSKIRKDVYEAELAAPRKLKVGDSIKFSKSDWETTCFIHRIEPYDGRYKETFDRVIYYFDNKHSSRMSIEPDFEERGMIFVDEDHAPIQSLKR